VLQCTLLLQLAPLIAIFLALIGGEIKVLPRSHEDSYRKVLRMYVPPLNSLLSILSCSRKEFDGTNKVSVPAPLLRLLLQLAVVNSDFNEAGYLRANPDVESGIKSKTVENALMHYIGYGYFEGRVGATPDVDEAWYLKTYTDVAPSVKSGAIKSATDHFNIIGAAEGRSPNAQYQAEAFQWKKALVPSA
jgi:hypothetical protein